MVAPCRDGLRYRKDDRAIMLTAKLLGLVGLVMLSVLFLSTYVTILIIAGCAIKGITMMHKHVEEQHIRYLEAAAQVIHELKQI